MLHSAPSAARCSPLQLVREVIIVEQACRLQLESLVLLIGVLSRSRLRGLGRLSGCPGFKRHKYNDINYNYYHCLNCFKALITSTRSSLNARSLRLTLSLVRHLSFSLSTSGWSLYLAHVSGSFTIKTPKSSTIAGPKPYSSLAFTFPSNQRGMMCMTLSRINILQG
ncbi:hypothetical protein FGO68_gene3723 [Halteria grandinella]|uniref:Uncharacterized protein n=1 Tax=Halteria grandinella TaxID=5974 RepID=A0A8J8P691_HALGN|nr:hypothetical protein FGO68_gene3723 [Halteria grandinella]